MTEQKANDRRRFLKVASGAALTIPLASLTACSGDEPSAPPPEPAAATPPPEAPAPEPEPTGPLRLQIADQQAQSLAYTHDATTVDASAQPRYEPGQACQNCLLFQGAEGDEWANCSIFPGRQVKATGWCNVYQPKSS